MDTRIPPLALALALLCAAGAARAAPQLVEVPLLLPDAFLRRLLVEQVLSEPGERVRLTPSGDPCSEVVLSQPQVAHARGRIAITLHARAVAGASLWVGGCVRPLEWEGLIEVQQEVRLARGAPVALFRVVDSSLRREGGWVDLPALWNWVKPLVHPRLETLRVDLTPLVDELRGTLPLFAPESEGAALRRLADSLALTSAQVEERGLVLRIGFEVEAAPAREAEAAPEPPLTPDQAEAFAAALREWDAFVTFVVKTSARDARERALRTELLAALLDARGELLAALQTPSASANARVRELFHSAWRQLAPALADLEAGPDGYRYLAFVASGDVLAALDAAGPAFGFELSSDGLRRLARTLAPTAREDPLAYSEEVDPELRRSFGFETPMPPVPAPGEEAVDVEADAEAPAPVGGAAEPATAPEAPREEPAPEPGAPQAEPPRGEPPPAPEPAPPEPMAPEPALPEPMAPAPAEPPPDAPPGEPPPAPEPEPPGAALEPLRALALRALALFAPAPAWAAPRGPRERAKPPPVPPPSALDRKVPRRADLETYLPKVAALLREAAAEVFAQSGLGSERRDLLRHLVLATAWQESCWRQYVSKRGALEPLRSRAGALGLMQVNPRVWRGFYSVDGLARSIHYNAHAGSEIVLHYLRDYAILRGEAAHGGELALARATYGAYNGGPSHLRRYREPKRWPRSLAAIDRAFLEKFEAIAAGRELAVRECYSG